MRLTIHQPEHLPWAGFFAKASQADVLVLLDNVQFRKNYFQNRNRILSSHGVQWLTVPVLMKGHTHATLRDIRINNTDRWRNRCWRTIEHAYRGHPFFERYEGFLENMYERDWEHLTTLNEYVIRQACSWLMIDTPFRRASELQVGGSSTQLILEICLATGATEYIAGPSSADYLDEESLNTAGIRVRHAWYEQQPYPQRSSDRFVENLSVIDMLFNCGQQSREIVKAGSRVDDLSF